MPSPPSTNALLRPPTTISRIKNAGQGLGDMETVLGKRLRSVYEEKAVKSGTTHNMLVTQKGEEVTSQHEYPQMSESESSDSESQSAIERALLEPTEHRRAKLLDASTLSTPSPPPSIQQAPQASEAALGPAQLSPPRRPSKKQLLTTLSVDQAVRRELGTQHGDNTRDEKLIQRETRMQPYPSIYRITCGDVNKASRHHSTFLFEDDPRTAAVIMNRSSWHLSGNKPIYRLRDYVEQFPQSSFVIIKDRNCKTGLGLSPDEEERNETMLILDDDLRQAILKVATCPVDRVDKPDIRNNVTGFLEMPAPYRFLYLHREKLQEYARSATTSLLKMIEAVLDHVRLNYAASYVEADNLMSQGKITGRHMNKLFYPNRLVLGIGPWSAYQSVFVVSSWPRFGHGGISVRLWTWAFERWALFRQNLTVQFDPPIEGQDVPFDISSLSWRPIAFVDEETIEHIRKCGNAYWSLRTPRFVHYHAENTGKEYRFTKPGRYMVDLEMHHHLHGSGVSSLANFTPTNKQIDPWQSYLTPESEPTEDEFLMMPNEVPAFDFLEKEWAHLPVSNIKPILWDKQPFEDLVLDENTKHLIKAMVTTRASTIKMKREGEREAHRNFDIVSGKGNGLIMLLHGSPGTGKTLTAESVAEIAQMPLYPITCGDIGTEPDKVEQYLRLAFMLGKRWNCVLLLDEADVFLEERTLTDLQRNSLVSVFLRMLEYYEGILILTSNRVGTFDEAFRSRIHISLHYEDLKPRSRKQIWNNFLERLEGTSEGQNVEEIRARVDELAKHKLNGREIRNALSTARQLASHEGVQMAWDHLELAIKTANDFGNYLQNVHGHSSHDWAREARTR